MKFLTLLICCLICLPSYANTNVVPRLSLSDIPETTNQITYNPEKLKRNTITLVGTAVATMALLYLMPSSFTNWDDEDTKNPTKKWWDNVSHAPVWDKDDFFLNYITHPYSGAIYYMGARSAGVSEFGSFLYSTALSTFFWEYGIEAFAERPSIQDLIVTPVLGSLLGEVFYSAKQNILKNNKQLWGSEAFGKTALFLMDPITEISDLIWENSESQNRFSLSSHPIVGQNQHFGYGIQMEFKF